MTTLFLAFLLLALVIMAMSIGVIFGRKPISGSCGGVGAALGKKDYTCDICGGDTQKCEEANKEKATNALYVDATQSDSNKK